MTANMIDITGRILARDRGRAVLIRQTSAIEADPEPCFGVAPIRMVSEELVQAIAFGSMSGPPQVAVRWNPLSRDPGQLPDFAIALEGYLTEALDAGRLPRIWVPHTAALEVTDLLGHRMRRNRNATPDLQRMGGLCRAIAVESEFPDQQVVAIAGDLLRAHVVTGQSPTEDAHVRALVAWVAPVPGVDPYEEAARRSLVPANAMLQRDVDDEVEHLRKIAKGRGRSAHEAKIRIELLLAQEAIREWDLLIEAREAFLSLGLQPVPGIGALVTKSLERFEWAVDNDPSPPSRPVALRRRLQTMEVAARRVEDITARSDARVRERLRKEGRVIAATVEGIDHPIKRRRPVSIMIRSNQPVVRVRVGTVLQTEDCAVKGRVTRIDHDPAAGGRLIELGLEKGRASSFHFNIGCDEDWYATDYYDNEFRRKQISKMIGDANAPIVFGNSGATAIPLALRTPGLVEAADRLRRN